MGPIIIAGVLDATVADLLNDTRLQTVPAGGLMTFEFQASEQSPTNSFDVSIQLPSGDTPMNAVPIAAGVTNGALNANDKTQASFLVQQGGHVTVGCTETGSATLTYRITYTPAARAF